VKRLLAGRNTPALVLGTIALVIGAAGAAYAAAAARTITVCIHHSGGGLYKAHKCSKHDKQLSWNKQGPAGPRGSTGPQGIQGRQGIPGSAGAPAVIARTRLDVANAEATTSSTSFTQVETLGQFTKQQSNTVLQITYDTEIGAPSGDYCFVQLRVDGLNDEQGSSTTQGTGSEAGEIDGNTTATVFAVFTGVPAGTHTLSVWERSASGGTCSENTGGWPRSAFVEEGS